MFVENLDLWACVLHEDGQDVERELRRAAEGKFSSFSRLDPYPPTVMRKGLGSLEDTPWSSIA